MTILDIMELGFWKSSRICERKTGNVDPPHREFEYLVTVFRPQMI